MDFQKVVILNKIADNSSFSLEEKKEKVLKLNEENGLSHFFTSDKEKEDFLKWMDVQKTNNSTLTFINRDGFEKKLIK